MDGFTTAAGCKTINPAREQHADEQMRAAWMAGWSQGKVARSEAANHCETLYGYQFSILREMEANE